MFSGEESLVYTSGRAKSLIERFGIKKVPAIIAAGSIDDYNGLSQVMLESGIGKKDGNYVIEAIVPPYRNLSTGRMEGLVEVVYLNDSGCKSCYDVLTQKAILQRFGVSVAKESFFDVGDEEGRKLAEKYNISRVPTIIVSPDLGVYSSLAGVWLQVGTVENDGYYVFRKVEVMGESSEVVLK